MNTAFPVPEEEMPGDMDRLVCGELDETGRGRVLAWLEADPVRWRLCGLAFLEAQTWSQTLADWPGTRKGRAPAAGVERRVLPNESLRKRSTLPRVLAALAVCVAFTLGLAVRDIVVPPDPAIEQPVAKQDATSVRDQTATDRAPVPVGDHEPLLAALDVQSGSKLGTTTPIRIPVVPAGPDSAQEARHAAEIPDYVRQQWERRGYKVSCERRYFFARLPDGQQIVVPVEQVNVNPTRVHIN